MIKKLFFVILSGFFCSQVCAQDSSGLNKTYHEIGVDAVPIVRQFINLTGRGYGRDPYFFLYRYHWGPWAVRGAFGVSYMKGESQLNDTAFSDGEYLTLEFRVGIERSENIHKRWAYYYGIDLLTSYYDNFAIVTESTRRSATYATKNNGYGAAAFLGIRFKINDRMFLTSEFSFRAIYLIGHDKRTYTLNPQYGHLIKSHGFESSFSPAASLYFNYTL